MEPNIPTNPEPQIPIQPITLPIQPTTEPIQVPAEQNFEPTKKSLPKWPLIIAGVILLATLLTGTYLLGKNQGINQKPASKTAQTPALTVTPTSTPDPTANWKTYSSDFFGISLKYPSEWSQLRHDTTPVGNSKYELTEVGIKNGISLTMELQENNNFKNSEDYLNFPSPINASEKILLQDGTPAHFYSQFSEGPMPQKGYWTYLMFFKNGKTYTFYIVDSENSQEQLMKMIIPTLKLTSQTSKIEALSLDPTASWKTYTSEKLNWLSFSGYTLKYPQDWTLKEEKIPATSSRVTISKNEYSIVIYQAAMGGAGCIYEGDVPDGPYADLRNKEFTDIETSFGTLRRTYQTPFDTKTGAGYSFCQKSKDRNSYGSITTIGGLSYETPTNPDKIILEEMDNILKTANTN